MHKASSRPINSTYRLRVFKGQTILLVLVQRKNGMVTKLKFFRDNFEAGVEIETIFK